MNCPYCHRDYLERYSDYIKAIHETVQCRKNPNFNPANDQNKAIRKLWYQFTGYDKQYRQEHKDQINEHHRTKVSCECGCVVSYGALSTHRKSQKHLHLMNALASSS